MLLKLVLHIRFLSLIESPSYSQEGDFFDFKKNKCYNIYNEKYKKGK